MGNFRTLKLDSSFRPIQIISSFEAFCMIYMGRANMIECYDNAFIRSAYEKFKTPCVISLNRYIKINKISLKCNRRNVFWRDKNVCQYCGDTFPESYLTLDHVTPRSKGGPKTWENIVTACKSCNQKKGDKLPYQANMQPIKHPASPSLDSFRILEQKNEIPKKWLPYLVGYKY